MSIAIEPSSFAANTELRLEIVAGGKYIDQAADWPIGSVASATVSSVPPYVASLSYLGVAWLDTFSPGGIRFTVVSGSVLITNVVLDALFPHPGPGGNRVTSHRLLTFAPQPGPHLSSTSLGANRARFTWPTNAVGYSLEHTTSLPAVNPWLWVPMTNSAAVVGAEFAVDLELTNGPGFFRLRRR